MDFKKLGSQTLAGLGMGLSSLALLCAPPSAAAPGASKISGVVVDPVEPAGGGHGHDRISADRSPAVRAVLLRPHRRRFASHLARGDTGPTVEGRHFHDLRLRHLCHWTIDKHTRCQQARSRGQRRHPLHPRPWP